VLQLPTCLIDSVEVFTELVRQVGNCNTYRLQRINRLSKTISRESQSKRSGII